MAAALPFLIPIAEALGMALLSTGIATITIHNAAPGTSWWSAIGSGLAVGFTGFVAKILPANTTQTVTGTVKTVEVPTKP